MRKEVAIYVPLGSPFGDLFGYASRAEAEHAVSLTPRLYPPGPVPIEERLFALPENAFWVGDLIAVELRRGDGWTAPVRGCVRVAVIELTSRTVVGWIVDPITGVDVVVLTLHVGTEGHSFRNATLVRAAGAA
jgi:hypothetical protein